MLQQGSQFSPTQIAAGLASFASVLSDEMDSFHTLVAETKGGEDPDKEPELKDQSGTEEMTTRRMIKKQEKT